MYSSSSTSDRLYGMYEAGGSPSVCSHEFVTIMEVSNGRTSAFVYVEWLGLKLGIVPHHRRLRRKGLTQLLATLVPEAALLNTHLHNFCSQLISRVTPDASRPRVAINVKTLYYFETSSSEYGGFIRGRLWGA